MNKFYDLRSKFNEQCSVNKHLFNLFLKFYEKLFFDKN